MLKIKINKTKLYNSRRKFVNLSTILDTLMRIARNNPFLFFCRGTRFIWSQATWQIVCPKGNQR